MTLKATIDRYAHMELVLSDGAWCADDFGYDIAHNLWIAAKAGQAEIDGLRAQLARLQSKVDDFDLEIEKIGYAECLDIPPEWDKGMAAWAQVKAQELRDEIAERVKFEDERDALAAQLAEARAQIAALTPAAEAYRACVRWENASSYGTQEECGAAWTEYLAATRRAIAFIPGATP